MNHERKNHSSLACPPEAVATGPDPEVESYPGQIEWYRLADGNGRLYRFGLIELTDTAGKRFWGGANRGHKLVILLDGYGIGHAYPFRVGKDQDNDFLALEYVQEKLGQALKLRQEVMFFTRTLGILLGRPTVKDKKEIQ